MSASASWSVRFELFVADHPRSIDFYTHVLGFTPEREQHDYVSLRRDAVVIGLGLIERLPDSGDGPGFTRSRLRADRGGGVEIVLETPDLDTAHRAVLASGYPSPNHCASGHGVCAISASPTRTATTCASPNVRAQRGHPRNTHPRDRAEHPAVARRATERDPDPIAVTSRWPSRPASY